MVQDREWDLPPANEPEDGGQIRFTRNELLLLDYVLTTGSRLIMPDSLDDLMVKWGEFRRSVWRAIVQIEDAPQEIGVLFPLDFSDASVLLASVPTTFTWGDGVDCGFSVKFKLAQFIEGVYEDDMVTARRITAELEIISRQVKEEEEARQREQTRQVAISNATTELQAATLARGIKLKESKDSLADMKQAKSVLETILEGEDDVGCASEDQASGDSQDEAGAPADAGAGLLAGEDLSTTDRTLPALEES